MLRVTEIVYGVHVLDHNLQKNDLDARDRLLNIAK
jgi:hypothetical protein